MMEQRPQVSVIVPVYDMEQHLPECLASIRDQTMDDLQIVCIDDASNDRSLEILRDVASAEPRMVVHASDVNEGPAAARNRGLDVATGQFVRFVDADDLLPPNSTLALLERAQDTDADLVRGSIALFRGEAANVVETVSVPDVRLTDFRSEPELWLPWWHTSYLISRQTISRHRLRYPDLRRGEDPVFTASLLVAAERISLLPEVVYLYRKYGKASGSAAVSFSDVRDSLEHARLVKAALMSHHPPAWTEAYGPHLAGDFREFLARCRLSSDERAYVRTAATEIWGSPEPVLGGMGTDGAASDARDDDGQDDLEQRTGVMNLSERSYWNSTFREPDPWDYASDYEQRKYRQTLELLPDRRPRRALELGCAEGMFTISLAPRVHELLAVDISDVALQRARERCVDLEHVTLAEHDIADGLPGSGYDLVVCSEILYYLRDAAAVQAFANAVWSGMESGGHLLMAHSMMVADDRTTTGFDFNEIGTRFIAELFAAHPGFEFMRELRTDLYRIQLFRRSERLDPDRPPASPREVLVRPHAPFDHAAIKWGGCAVTSAEAKHCWQTEELPILNYHRVASDGPRELAQYRVGRPRFERQLAWLQRQGWHSVSLSDYVSARFDDGHSTTQGKAVAFTFDDAYADFAENAWPLLRRYGFGATLFVPVDYVGGRAEWDADHGPTAPLLTWDQLRELRDQGVEIASHGCSHQRMFELSPEDALEEARRSREVLRQELGIEAAGFCYPYNWADPAARQAVAEAGYRYGVYGADDGTRPEDRDPHFLPRVEVFGSDTLDEFIAKLPRPSPAPDESIARYLELRARRDRATYMGV